MKIIYMYTYSILYFLSSPSLSFPPSPRAILEELFKGSSDQNELMLIGKLLHVIFQKVRYDTRSSSDYHVTGNRDSCKGLVSSDGELRSVTDTWFSV